MYSSEIPKIICLSYEGIFQVQASIQLNNLTKEDSGGVKGEIYSNCLRRHGGQTFDEQTAM